MTDPVLGSNLVGLQPKDMGVRRRHRNRVRPSDDKGPRHERPPTASRLRPCDRNWSRSRVHADRTARGHHHHRNFGRDRDPGLLEPAPEGVSTRPSKSDLRNASSAVESWTTDNPQDRDGPATSGTPLTNYTTASDSLATSIALPGGASTQVSPGNYMSIYTHSTGNGYCIAAANTGSSKKWTRPGAPTSAQASIYDSTAGGSHDYPVGRVRDCGRTGRAGIHGRYRRCAVRALQRAGNEAHVGSRGLGSFHERDREPHG